MALGSGDAGFSPIETGPTEITGSLSCLRRTNQPATNDATATRATTPRIRRTRCTGICPGTADCLTVAPMPHPVRDDAARVVPLVVRYVLEQVLEHVALALDLLAPHLLRRRVRRWGAFPLIARVGRFVAVVGEHGLGTCIAEELEQPDADLVHGRPVRSRRLAVVQVRDLHGVLNRVVDHEDDAEDAGPPPREAGEDRA